MSGPVLYAHQLNFVLSDFSIYPKADSYGNEKLIRKWTKSVLFFVFFNVMGTRMVQIRIAKSV